MPDETQEERSSWSKCTVHSGASRRRETADTTARSFHLRLWVWRGRKSSAGAMDPMVHGLFLTSGFGRTSLIVPFVGREFDISPPPHGLRYLMGAIPLIPSSHPARIPSPARQKPSTLHYPGPAGHQRLPQH